MNKCMDVISRNKEKILNNVLEYLRRADLEYQEIYVYKSRVAGLCRPNSDIDVFVLLSEKHREFVNEEGKRWDGHMWSKYVSWGEERRGLTSIDKVYGEEYPEGWWPIELDVRMGCNMPPRPEKYIDRKFIIRFEEVP